MIFHHLLNHFPNMLCNMFLFFAIINNSARNSLLNIDSITLTWINCKHKIPGLKGKYYKLLWMNIYIQLCFWGLHKSFHKCIQKLFLMYRVLLKCHFVIFTVSLYFIAVTRLLWTNKLIFQRCVSPWINKSFLCWNCYF